MPLKLLRLTILDWNNGMVAMSVDPMLDRRLGNGNLSTLGRKPVDFTQ